MPQLALRDNISIPGNQYNAYSKCVARISRMSNPFPMDNGMANASSLVTSAWKALREQTSLI